MPKIKVPTSPLKRPARIPRRPLDVVTCIADIKGTETAKEKKNGLKTKEKLCTTTSSKEIDVFGGFSLKTVLKEYSELASALCTPTPALCTLTPAPSTKNVRPKREGKTNALILIDDDSSSEESSSSSSTSEDSSPSPPSPPSPPREDYIPKPRSKPPILSLTKTGEVRKRGVRCGECPACLRPDDCGACDFCRDKPKFGGPGIKKQACIYRKCNHLIRHVPLKCPKRVYIPDGSPPPPRRHKTTPTDTHPLHASPIRPRRFNSASDRIANRSKNSEPETPHLNIFWPMEADISGTPIYSVKSLTSRPSVCLKCGGAGKMIRCLVCCQSVHSFCAEVKGQDGYTCPSCITCRVCGHGNNCVACVVCGGRFHERCASSDHRSSQSNGGWRCVSCTKCLSCKTTTPGTDIWYEDYTYCNGCHSLKVKGNYCPLCGECYSDSDYDSKMIQCGRCEHWVHASCEGMTDQDYEILSELPEDDVLFLCRLCSTDHSWKPTVDQFFQESIGKLMEVFGRWRSEFKQHADMEHSNLINFNAGIMSRLANLLSSLSASSSSRRQLTSARDVYEEMLSELFPWFQEEVAKNNSRETTPTNHTLDWPAILSHDHCYWSSGATKETDTGRGATPTATPTSDQRRCVLCSTVGDTDSEGPGRLLPCSVDEWIHVNCAVWSAEVYEEVTGTLRCVQAAITRGCRLRCDSCREVGATVGCCTSSCSANFHFQCARDARCAFLNNKEVYCSKHRGGVATSDILSVTELMAVDHCIFIDAHPDRPGRKMPRKLEAAKIAVQLGSLVVSHMGGLVELSDTPTTLFPHKYRCEFWSVDAPSTPTHYTLTVSSAQPDDWITLLETTPAVQTTPTSNEHDILSVEVGDISKSIWDDLFSPPTKKVKVQTVQSAPLKPLNGGVRFDPETAAIVTNGMTFVPVIRDSQLILYPAPYLNGLSPNKEQHATPLYPNPRAIEDFKIPKRKIDCLSSGNLITSSEMSTTSLQVSSEDVVSNSATLRRLKAGLQGNPLCLTFKVTSGDGRSWTNNKLEDVWMSVLSELQEQRAKLDLPYLPYPPSIVYRQFGLDHPLIVQLLEQLPDSPRCTEYQFRYHTPSHSNHWRSLRTLDNPTGCARSQPYNGIRSPRDMFSFLTSVHRPEPPALDHMTLEIVMATSENTSIAKLQSTSDLPAAMRYRSLQKTYKQHVDVFGSGIHGLGLFCVKDIDPGDMVIEYTGTVIRSVLTDKREKIYDSKGIGCYMFRIDSEDVVDATMSGNQARFINHSCEPNCYSKVITCDGNKKIMIFALRKIVPGEELTYDYKFPLEDAKIPCNCGTRRCRKTMN